MSAILRGVIVRSVPTVRSMIIQKRGIRTHKPLKPLQAWESAAGFAVLSLGCLALPCWIMSHLEDYKARDE